ncbi:hypothetical protein BJV82DRAFT_638152 [Fennellomyces sp. T-0311]|nr:hypothetical protein BJV82DRAFT_638152 [Fennellomyces sp. T-0311]
MGKPQLRFIAEVNATRRQDAMNLINLHLGGLRLGKGIPRFDRPELDLLATFEAFRGCIRNQETGETLYEPDTLDNCSLATAMADNFVRQVIQDYHEHMRNLPRFVAIVWEQIIDGHHIENANVVKRAARLITQNLDINDHYENMHIGFENWLGLDVPIQRLHLCMRILGFSSSLLQFAELLGLPKRWSLLPIASHQVVNFTDHENPLPQPLQREDGRVLATRGIHREISDNNVKQVIWEAIFEMDDVKSNRFRLGDNLFLEYQKELQNRAKSGITTEHDMIRNHSSHVSSPVDFQGYIRVIAQIRSRMKNFAMHYKHRDIRATLAAARQSTQAQITNELLGISPPRLPRYVGWEWNSLPTISFWGDGMIQFASRHMFVIITNEMYTRQVHAACDTPLRALDGVYHHCEHRYKCRRTATGNDIRGRNIRWCVDEDSVFLGRKSECDERQNRASEVWALKRCTNVDAHIHPVSVNRDMNAAKNMRHIEIAYMELDGHPDHRPPALRLPPPMQMNDRPRLKYHNVCFWF